MRFVLVLLQASAAGRGSWFLYPRRNRSRPCCGGRFVHLEDRSARSVASFGIELLIGEVGANHQQHIAVHHGVIAGRESEQPCHAHIEGVVVLDELFPAHRMNDGSFQLVREFDQLLMSSGAAGAAEDGYFLRAIQQVRQHVDFVVGRTHGGLRLGKMQPRCLLDRISQGHIARDSNHRNAAARDGGLHGDLQHARHLLRMGHQLAVMAALREEMFGMGFLKISAADFVAGNLRRDGQHRNAAAMAIVKAVDQMQIAWPATSGADRQFARSDELRRRRQTRPSLRGACEPTQICSRLRIESVIPLSESPAHAVDPLNARFQQNIYKQVRYFLCHFCSFRTQERPLEQPRLRYFRPANQATCTPQAGCLEVALLVSRWATLSTCPAPGSCLR